MVGSVDTRQLSYFQMMIKCTLLHVHTLLCGRRSVFVSKLWHPFIQFILANPIHFALLCFFSSRNWQRIRGIHLWIIDELFELMSNRFDSRLISRLNTSIHEMWRAHSVHVCRRMCSRSFVSSNERVHCVAVESMVSMFRNLSAVQTMVSIVFPVRHVNRMLCAACPRTHRKMKRQKSIQYGIRLSIFNTGFVSNSLWTASQ